MIEILPNWHPFFVHFPIALYLTSAILIIAAMAMPDNKLGQKCLIVGQWNLYLGAGFSILTIAAGFYAANTVAHNDTTHLAMIDHRNWALSAATLWFVLAVWNWRSRKAVQMPSGVFVALLAIASVLILTAGWKGGELVYRHGTGVLAVQGQETMPHSHDGEPVSDEPDDHDDDDDDDHDHEEHSE